MLVEAVQNLVMYKLYQKDNDQDTTRVFIEIIRRGEARKEKELCKKVKVSKAAGGFVAVIRAGFSRTFW